MKILVSQEEYIKFSKPFDALERNYYHFLADHEIIPVPNIVKVPDYDYDCLVLTGGPDSPARHKTENILFAHAFKKKPDKNLSQNKKIQTLTGYQLFL